MGDFLAGASRCLKVLFYLVVIGSSSAMLYGFVKTANSLKKCSFGGSVCILFGDFDSLSNDSCTPDELKNGTTTVGGSMRVCEFCIGSAATQLVLAVLGCVVVVYRMRRHKPSRSALSAVELFVTALAFAAAFGAALTVAMGFKLFCERISEHWNDTNSIYHRLSLPKPGHCRDASLTMDGKTASVRFYDEMNVAHVSSWIAAGTWFLHLMMSICSVLSYRKHGATPVKKEKEDKKKKQNKEKEKEKKKKQKEAKNSKKSGGKKYSAWDEA